MCMNTYTVYQGYSTAGPPPNPDLLSVATGPQTPGEKYNKIK